MQRRLDRIDRAGEHVPEQEDEDSGGERGEASACRRPESLNPRDGQAEEDRRAGDRAEEKDVCGAHVRVALQPAYGQYSQMAQGHSVDEYLETIYFLAFPIGEYMPRGSGSPPLASRVAEMLHVSRASAGEMLKRLEAAGLIERGARQEALLTRPGRDRAERVVRKHRLIERLLTDFMGYTGYGAHPRPDRLGDTFSDKSV